MSLQLFATVFAIIFVAELPDKTALASLALATRHRALPVFLGASCALSIQSVVAVGAGSLFARLDSRYVHLGSGVMFLACALLMWIRRHDDDERASDARAGFWRSLGTTFAVIFIAEWGDLTQLGTAALEARYHAWTTVLVASIAALWCVTALAVFVGNRAGKLLEPRVAKRAAAIAFAAVGVVLVVGAR